MKKILSLGLIALVFALTTLVIAPQAQAQTAPTEAQCMTAKERILALATKVDTTKAAQLKVYTGIQTQFDDFVTNAQQSSYDTEAMIAAQTALSTKVAAYTTASTNYSAALTAIKDVTCTATNEEFVAAVTDARSALTAARTATTDVRVVIRADIMDALKGYASSLSATADTEEAN